MALLVRKINRNKWPEAIPATAGELPADAITGCFRTSSSTVSTWRINDIEQLEEALLALVTAPATSKLESFDVVCLDPEALAAAALPTRDTPGATKVETLKNAHVDVVVVNHAALGALGLHAASQICGAGHVRCEVQRIVQITRNAIQAGRITLDDFNPEYLKKLRARGLNL